MTRPPRPYGDELTETLPNVRISPTLMERVNARATADGTYVSDLVRTAVLEWLDKPTPKLMLSLTCTNGIDVCPLHGMNCASPVLQA